MTSQWNKFSLLIWKNWVLQKRHKLRTLLEVLSPVIFVSLMVLVRSLVEPKMSPVMEYKEFTASNFTYFSVPIDSGGSITCPTKIKLSYSPNSTVVEDLLRDSAKYLLLENVQILGGNRPNVTDPNVLPLLLAYFERCFGSDIDIGDIPGIGDLPGLIDWILDKIFIFQGYRDAQTLERQLINPTENDTSLCGVQFDDDLIGLTSFNDWPSHTVLTLRFPAQLRKMFPPNPFLNWRTNFLYPPFETPGPRSRDENVGGWPSYVKEGFLPVAHSILNQLTKRKSNNSPQPKLWLQRFPHPEFLSDDLLPALEGFISLIILLSFNYTCINTIRAIAIEKEKQLKEVMKIMGLSNWLHWTAWFVKTFSYLMLSIIFIVVLLKVEWYKTDEGLAGYSVFTFTPWHVILVFLMIFVMTTICFCFMISTFFSKANTAATVAGLTWFLSYVPYMFLQTDRTVPSLGARVAACLASNTAMAYGFQIILRNEATAEGLQWGNFFSPLTVDDSFVMGHVILMLIFDGILYLFIALYVEQVWPGSYGVPQPWYFPISKEFWRSACRFTAEVEDVPHDDNETPNDTIESDPKGLNVGINIINLTKIYNKKIAVEKLKLKIFEDQITVLLGHNGAGKTTTMSMLTGMFPPTSGTAIVAGHDIRTNIDGVRDSLGICPQHNVLFADLTVAEHIDFYATLKGVPADKIKEQVDKYIKLLGLEDKRNVISSALSGGMQRRLSVGTALCGNSKVVLLDEPSSGMDPAARRQLWDLLHLEKIGRTIILTTHFMDEAEILGERVAILSKGKLRCVGSPFYLKKKLGMGYRLTAARQSSALGSHTISSTPVLNLLKVHVPPAKLYTDIGSEVSFVLPEDYSTKFEPMLRDLEDKQNELGLISFGISASTLEEVFMRVGADLDNAVEEDNDSFKNLSTNELILDNEKHHDLNEGAHLPDSSLIVYSGMKLVLNQWKAMLLKKFLVFLRTWGLCLLQIFLPIFFLTIAIIVSRMWSNPTQLPSKDLDLSVGYRDSETYLNYDPDLDVRDTGIVEAYKDYFVKSNIKSMVLTDLKHQNMSEYYLENARENMPTMRVKNLVGATITADKSKAWFSNFGYHEIPASFVLAHRAIMNTLTGSNSTFSLINNPLPFTIQSRIELLMYGDGGSFQISFNVGFSMAFVSSFFLLFYVKENITRSKLLQYASGVSPFILWTVAYIIDLLWFICISVGICITLVSFQQNGLSTGKEIGRVFAVHLIFGWAMLPIQYLVSSLFKSPSTAFSRMCFFNFLTGLATFLVVEVLYAPGLNLEHVADILHKIFLLFPHYSVSSAIKYLNQGAVTLKTCYAACDLVTPDGVPCSLDYLCNHPVFPLKFCCISEDPYFEWAKPGIGAHLTYMGIVGLFLYLLLLAKEYKVQNLIFGTWSPKPALIEPTEEDSDVAAERARIASLTSLDYHKYNLLCKDMTKYYDKFLAVDQLSIGVKDAECFGLLGINGAGKTTTFKMLTGDLRISSGDAWVKGNSVNTNMKSVYQNIGYCPQFDALLDEMTGRETLKMFSLLRGIPQWRQERFINSVSVKLGFQKHLDKQVQTYSGGNKRKLSTSIALLGDPQVVYLDEPTTGMDPAAKRLVWNAIAGCQCVILTSHSMEECEALCSRLAIMVNGRPQCLGSPQHLKNKFSQGYTLIVKLRRISHARDNDEYPDILLNQPISNQTSPIHANGKVDISGLNSMFNFEILHNFLKQKFPDAKVIETYQGLVTYYLPDTTIKWSTIFGVMEAAKEELDIEDYSIGQTSLEQIFLQFTKDQREERDAIPKTAGSNQT